MCRGIQISVRDNNLFSFERQCQLERPTALSYDIFDSAMTLFKNNYDWANPIRSFGVRAINLVGSDTAVQTSLFEDEERRQKRERLDLAVEDIRMRFGHSSIRRAIILQDHTLSGLNPPNTLSTRSDTSNPQTETGKKQTGISATGSIQARLII